MPSFYHPFTSTFQSIPVIVYPHVGLETVVSRGQQTIAAHLALLYQANDTLIRRGQFHIALLWTDHSNIMSDIWVFGADEDAQSGPTADVITCRGTQIITGNGVSAADGLIVLGKEMELEEKIRKQGKQIKTYIGGNRPAFDDDLCSGELF